MLKNILLGLICLGLFSCAQKETSSTSVETEVDKAKETVKSVEEKATKEAKKAKKKTEAAAETASTHGAGTQCKFESETRSIEAVKTEGGGCETKYTKNGETQSVASSQSGIEYCQQVAEKIKSNLTTAGFTCE